MQINYHGDKYKEVCDWNRNQSGGNTRQCDYFDIIDGILGPRDIVTFSEVVGAGYEAEEEPTNEDASVRVDGESETESLSIAIPSSSSPSAFEVRESHLTEIWEEENTDDELFGQTEPSPSTHIRERGERKTGGSGKRKITKEQEQARYDEVLEKMTKQGDELVAAVKRMEENSLIQTNALQEMSRSLGLFFSRQGRQAKSKNQKKQRRKDDSEDSETY